MVDRFSNSINTIKTHEIVGKEECVLDSTKLIKAVLDAMIRESYIESYEEFSERHAKKLRVKLSKRINDIGVIKPRFSISKDMLQKYESRYVPSRDFGVLIISTPQGIMTSREIKDKNTGGRLLAYVY
ncbi:MAG: 30S ribosomal protein S8 [Candidatus Marsarchaeota archaeon]|nr:30S ribosomal protein S8 [Candidatus Marsarchaeota archaeon]